MLMGVTNYLRRPWRQVWANPGELASLAGDARFDVVVDNNGKDLDSVGPVVDFAVKVIR